MRSLQLKFVQILSLDLSKMEAFANDKINPTQIWTFSLGG